MKSYNIAIATALLHLVQALPLEGPNQHVSPFFPTLKTDDSIVGYTPKYPCDESDDHELANPRSWDHQGSNL